ncbi:MAG: SCO family protein [Bacteroidota bacterium]
MKKQSFFPIILVSFALVFLLVGGYRAYMSKKPARVLPTYGQDERDSVAADGKKIPVQVVHTVQQFNFIDQTGKTITQKDFDGKIYVTDFFFTTCPGICPKMTKQMERVYAKYKDNNQVLFLSHTVNPKQDSVPVLAEYAELHKADARKWHFVTGDKKELYDMARYGYFVTATEGDGGESDFVHTEKFVLVDKDKRIRGYYNGTDSTEVDKLIIDMHLLLSEYAYQEK